MKKIQQEKNKETIKTKFSPILKLILLLICLTLGLAYRFTNYQSNQTNKRYNEHESIRYALIGDIGGTNIRYQLVSFFKANQNNYTVLIEQRMKVKDYDQFESSVQHFLSSIKNDNYPHVAVIAMAGPIHMNTVALSNVPKWGKINGTQLTTKFNISQFLFINDFEAISYGLLIVEEDQFVKLNDKKIDPTKIRGVIGPGTGLGHSIIINNPLIQDNIMVLPSQAGHSDSPYIDEQTVEYIEFLKVKYEQNYIDVEKAFCGPTLPYMLEFFSQKLQMQQHQKNLTSEQIIVNCMKENPEQVYKKVYEMFMKLYSSAIGNFMIQHMTTGGIYLVGGLTKSLIGKIQEKDILQDWKSRHPEMRSLIEQMPIVFCNEVDLGLRGAFVMSTRLINKLDLYQVNKIQKEEGI